MQKERLFSIFKSNNQITKISVKFFLGTIVSLSLLFSFVTVQAEELKGMIIKSEGEFEGTISSNSENVDTSYGIKGASDENLNIPEVAIAQVNLKNVKIISQQDNSFQISFQITNKSAWIQPNIRYSVLLVAEENIDNFSINGVARQIYDEELNLNGGESLKRKVTYLVPTYLVGKYLLVVEARLPGGMFLKAQKADNPVILKGNQQFLEIVSSSCYLSTAGDQVNKRYGIQEGVVIDPQKEKLIGICQVINHTNEQVKFTPNFKIYSDSIFGSETQNTGLRLGEFQINPHETKKLIIPLPVDLNPRVYDTEVFLKNQENIFSNSVVMRYIIKNASATIQNVAFDKPSYAVGETAKVGFSWSGDTNQSFDFKTENIGAKKLIANILIKNQIDGQICGQIDEILNPKMSNAYITIPITANCKKPLIISTIKDESGNILDWRESQPSQRIENFFLKSNKIIAISVLSILLVFFLMITFFLNGKSGDKKEKHKKRK
ncbi:MAG: hypothetical protein U9P90_03570 [Patescibacteria group bacterium]|nr:hypothetical protein [Patescibacteria group bacterium]